MLAGQAGGRWVGHGYVCCGDIGVEWDGVFGTEDLRGAAPAAEHDTIRRLQPDRQVLLRSRARAGGRRRSMGAMIHRSRKDGAFLDLPPLLMPPVSSDYFLFGVLGL